MDKIVVAIPFYKNPQLVKPVVESLIACSDELISLNASVYLFNDSPEYPELQHELDKYPGNDLLGFDLTVVRNERNMGFIGTINQAFRISKKETCDIVILNSDTTVFSGTIRELQEVAYSDPMIGFVSPRSNNATICTVPHYRDDIDRTVDQCHTDFLHISAALPRLSYVPTAVGFCLYIKWTILAEFGGFDPIYDKGYNEENDLIMRAGRFGYRAVLANHAFVWHEGETSFSVSGTQKSEREDKNRKILLSRYPEYEVLISRYFNSPDYRAERLLDCLASKQITIGFDFSSFGPYHNGTFEAGKRILAAAARTWPSDINLIVYTSDTAWDFHKLSSIPRVRLVQPELIEEKPIAIVRMGQPFDIETLSRLYYEAPIVAIFMLDTISDDCVDLSAKFDNNVWRFTMSWTDIVFAISNYTADQLKRRYAIGQKTLLVPTLCSVSVDDYQPTVEVVDRIGKQPYLLIIGNKFTHKAIVPTVTALASAMNHLNLVVLGGEQLELDNVTCIHSGGLSDKALEELFSGADAFIFPTHYEGFGFPLMHALARSKPIFVRNIPVFHEIADSLITGRENIHWFDTTVELTDLIRHNTLAWQGPPAKGEDDGWARSAGQVFDSIRMKIENLDQRFIAERLRWFDLFLKQNSTPVSAVDRYNLVARNISRRVEWELTRILSHPIAYKVARTMWRIARRIR